LANELVLNDFMQNMKISETKKELQQKWFSVDTPTRATTQCWCLCPSLCSCIVADQRPRSNDP